MRLIASMLVSSFVVTTVVTTAATADIVTVTFGNLQQSEGFAFTPAWLGFHDGSFNVFGPGQAASLFDGVEQVAELGDTSALSSRFSSAQPLGLQMTVLDQNGAPVFSPGESRTVGFDLDPTQNAYFSFMSMLVPTNDLFIGNPAAIQLFNGGVFNGPVTIDIYGSMVWDAGTEVNDLLNGGAFVAGVDATLGAKEGGFVHLLYSNGNAQSYLDSIVGTTTADGGFISQSFNESTLLGRITIVPAPGAGLFLVVSLLCSRGRRRDDHSC